MRQGTILKLLVGLLVLGVLAVFTGSALAQTTPDWELIYETDANVAWKFGNLQDFATAINEGASVKVVIFEQDLMPIIGQDVNQTISRILDGVSFRRDASGNIISVVAIYRTIYRPSSGVCRDDLTYLEVQHSSTGHTSKVFTGPCLDKPADEWGLVTPLKWYVHR